MKGALKKNEDIIWMLIEIAVDPVIYVVTKLKPPPQSGHQFGHEAHQSQWSVRSRLYISLDGDFIEEYDATSSDDDDEDEDDEEEEN